MLSEDKIKDILFKLTMLGFEEEYDEKKDNLKSYLKGRRDAFKDVLSSDGEIKDCGHTPYIEKPTVFNQTILKYLVENLQIV